MTSPFGPGPLTVLRRPEVLAGGDDLARVLAAARPDSGSGEVRAAGPVLLLGRCAPTAAFSRRDTLRPGHARAAVAARDRGFEALVRPVGGHLAAYDEGALVLHLWAEHPDPRRDLQRRFRIVADAIADALTVVGVPDVRVGAVPGEYCDGAWSVNVGGRAKVAGTGQRLFRRGYLFCAVVSVTRSEPTRELLVEAYDHLDLPLDPGTVGSVEDSSPGTTVDRAREAIAGTLARAVTEARAGTIRVEPLLHQGMQTTRHFLR